MKHIKVPFDILWENVADEGSDFNDGLMGYASGTIRDNILTLRFEPMDEPEPSWFDPEITYLSTEYKFKLEPIERRGSISSVRAGGYWMIFTWMRPPYNQPTAWMAPDGTERIYLNMITFKGPCPCGKEAEWVEGRPQGLNDATCMFWILCECSSPDPGTGPMST